MVVDQIILFVVVEHLTLLSSLFLIEVHVVDSSHQWSILVSMLDIQHHFLSEFVQTKRSEVIGFFLLNFFTSTCICKWNRLEVFWINAALINLDYISHIGILWDPSRSKVSVLVWCLSFIELSWASHFGDFTYLHLLNCYIPAL